MALILSKINGSLSIKNVNFVLLQLHSIMLNDSNFFIKMFKPHLNNLLI